MLGQEVLLLTYACNGYLNELLIAKSRMQVDTNGKSERVDINKLEDYVTKLTAESEERASFIMIPSSVRTT